MPRPARVRWAAAHPRGADRPRSASGWRRPGRGTPDRSDWRYASFRAREPEGPHRARAPPLPWSLKPVSTNWILISKPVREEHGPHDALDISPGPRDGRYPSHAERTGCHPDALPGARIVAGAGRGALRGAALLVGLSGYGVSMAMMVRAGLGLDPWDVLHQGLALRTGMTIGLASAVVGVAVLRAWIPLRNRPGIGTVANVIVIAITVDLALWLIPTPTSMPVRVAMMLAAVVFNAVSTVLYIGAG